MANELDVFSELPSLWVLREMRCVARSQRNCVPYQKIHDAGRCIFIFSDARIFPMSDDDRMVDYRSDGV